LDYKVFDIIDARATMKFIQLYIYCW